MGIIKSSTYKDITAKNVKKPFWTKIVTAILVIIAIDLALLLIDFSQVFITHQEPRFAHETAVSSDQVSHHYTGLGYSFDVEGKQTEGTFQVTRANLNIFGKYICTTK